MCSVRGADVGFMIKANLYIPSTKNTQMNIVILLYVKSVYFYTGCNCGKWKKVQANILKEPLVLIKQTRPQQKALDLSFNLAP